jgi:glycerol-3-phosphate dehydrogenase (NAD(P)+)
MSKGIESESLLLPSELVSSILRVPITVLSGPSFACDLAHRKLTACVLAGEYLLTESIQQIIATDYFITKLSSDLIGVQVAGALKNCTALGIGILDSLDASDNTKALFLTRCWQEITQVITAKGGLAETALGLAGIGDFLLTCLGTQSRNVKLGKAIGKGLSLEQALAELGHVPEGLNTLKSVPKLVTHYAVSLPVHQTLYSVIFEQAHRNSLIDILAF